MAATAARNRGSSSRMTFQMSDGDSDAYWVSNHVADVANADPANIGVLLLERFRDCTTRFGDNQKRALNDVRGAPVFGELLERQRVSLFGDTIRRSCRRGRCGDRAPSKDSDLFPLDLLSQSRMQAVARRQVDVGVESFLQVITGHLSRGR
jgi:hypothetical protein